MSDPVKPTPKTRVAYDYHEVTEYLEKKYKFNSRDYAGRFIRDDLSDKPKPPYQDFWHSPRGSLRFTATI